MTPADLERVRDVLWEHVRHEVPHTGQEVCSCGWVGSPHETHQPGGDWAAHIVAVLAAQDEAGGTGQ